MVRDCPDLFRPVFSRFYGQKWLKRAFFGKNLALWRFFVPVQLKFTICKIIDEEIQFSTQLVLYMTFSCQKSHFQSFLTIKTEKIGSEWIWEVQFHGAKCCRGDILALGKSSSPLGDSHVAADVAVAHLGLGMAPAQVWLRLEPKWPHQPCYFTS